jgi:hypothetical protein
VPDDPAQALLAALLEDMADEWDTKPMFMYRWLRERQVGRIALVGCTPQIAPLVGASADRVMALLEAHVTEERFLFGGRPSIADFAWMGQRSQLTNAPTACEHLRAGVPFVLRGLMHLDDASGVDGDWRAPGAPASPAVAGLLAVAAEVYFPFLESNAAAIAAGRDTFAFEAWGMRYEQGTFKYRVRCLAELRDAYRSLPAAARARVDADLPASAREALARGWRGAESLSRTTAPAYRSARSPPRTHRPA